MCVGVCGVLHWFWVFGRSGGFWVRVVGFLVGVDGFVLSPAVAGSVGCC